MYNNSFWDTVKGHEVASVFTNAMLELSEHLSKEKKQEVFTVFKSNIYSFLKGKFEKGYTYVDSMDLEIHRKYLNHIVMENAAGL